MGCIYAEMLRRIASRTASNCDAALIIQSAQTLDMLYKQKQVMRQKLLDQEIIIDALKRSVKDMRVQSIGGQIRKIINRFEVECNEIQSNSEM